MKIYNKMPNQYLSFAMMALMLLLWAEGCARTEKARLYPSYEDVVQRGFYLYVLPEDVLAQLGGTEMVTISSWERHCKNMDAGETYNPLTIVYRHLDSDPFLTISIESWLSAWDHGAPTTSVHLTTSIAKEQVALRYASREADEYTSLKFEDQFGNFVLVGSPLPQERVVQLVNQLEYIGPPPEEVSNPWACGKENR